MFVRPVVRVAPKLMRSAAAQPAGALAVRHTGTATADATLAAKSKWSGSFHWNTERALAASVLALVPAAVLAPSAPVDYALGVILPLHCYMGLMVVVTDYVPKHRVPGGYWIASTAVRASTALVMYGLYKANSTDIGVTESIKQFWKSF